jgi:hypothetical protein
MTVTGDLIGPVLGPLCRKGKGTVASDEAGIAWTMRQGFGKQNVLSGLVPWSAVTRFELGRTTPRVAALSVTYQNGPANVPAGSLTLITTAWEPPRYEDGWLVSKPSLYSIAYHAEMYVDPEARHIEDSGLFGPVTHTKYEQARFDRALNLRRQEHLDLHSRWGARGYKRYPGANGDSDESFYDWIAAGCPDEWSPAHHRAYLLSYIETAGGWTWPPASAPELADASADEICAWLNNPDGRR